MSEEQIKTAERAAESAEKAFPSVKVSVGGKERNLKYTLYAFCQLHKVTGKSPLDGSIFREMSPEDIAALAWSAMLHEDPNLDMDEMAKQILPHELPGLTTAIAAAFRQANPEATDDGKKNPPASPDLTPKVT